MISPSYLVLMKIPHRSPLFLTLFLGLFCFAKVGNAQFSKGVRLLSVWDSEVPVLNGSMAKYNDVWAFEWEGEEYAVIGSTIGTHIIHLKANNANEEVGYIQGGASGNWIVHRDFDFHKGFLYSVCDQEPSWLQVIDCRNLPHSVELIQNETHYFTTAHNLFCDQATGKLYASGSSGHAMSVLDVGTNPSQPALLAHFDLVNYVHDCYVQNDTAYLHAAQQGFYIFDFSDPVNPQALGSLEDYPEKGYNHSGWLSEDGNHYIFTDETPGMRMKMCDVSDFSDIQITDLFWSYSEPQTMVHNVMIKGNLAYVSHYFDGLEIYDISDPSDVQRVAWYDTFREDHVSGRGAWGIHALLPSGKILVSDRQTGLYVFKLEEGYRYPRQPSINIAGNPGNGAVVVSLAEFDYRKVSYEVIDARGRRVASQEGLPLESKHIDIDLSSAAEGMYFINVFIDGILHQGRYCLVP